MFSSFDEANSVLLNLKGKSLSDLHIGSYGSYDVMTIVGRYRRRFPSVTLSVDFSNSEISNSTLRSLDKSSASQNSTHCRSRPPIVVIAPRNGAWMGRQSVSAADLKDEIIVRREPGSVGRASQDRFFEKANIPASRLHQFGRREGVINAVAEGVGIGTIFDEGGLPEDRVVKLKIAGPPVLSRVDVVCLANRRTSPLISGFFDVAQEVLLENGASKHGTSVSGRRAV
jgi:LysR family transcriptional regulator, low CO2-responsive transcriptional regulator